ncbi:hypothetical protein EDB19DRAFT_1777326, partial [Suillus lakei]
MLRRFLGCGIVWVGWGGVMRATWIVWNGVVGKEWVFLNISMSVVAGPSVSSKAARTPISVRASGERRNRECVFEV